MAWYGTRRANVIKQIFYRFWFNIFLFFLLYSYEYPVFAVQFELNENRPLTVAITIVRCRSRLKRFL